ncbi:MAG: 5-oxoprolinase subunit PxpA [Akkermansiaceae bacterium]
MTATKNPFKTIDLNADLGEGGNQDHALMTFASSANIACGGHTGNEESIRRAVELATQTNTTIGAHPGYEDPSNFGRKPMHLSSTEIRDLLHRQLERILQVHPQLHHVKPHGALYNQANQDVTMASALVAAIVELQPNTILYCPPYGSLAKAAAELNLNICPEGFIDRTYQNDGNLCPRTEKRAVISDSEQAISQALQIALEQKVHTIQGKPITLEAKTLCIHGDSPGALDLLRLTRSSLEENGIKIVAPCFQS